MSLLTTSWDFRLLWTVLPIQTRGYLLCLFAAAIYSGISLRKTFIRIRRLPGIMPGAEAEAFYRSISARLRNLRQLHFLFLLLFGLFLTDEAFRAERAHMYSRMSLACVSFNQLLDPLLCFAFVVLLVLTILHALQWFVASRLERKSHGH